jgi:NTP pyrophosphatase (non-canonical NTP hydrolase)
MQQGKTAAESELQVLKATLQEVRNENSRDRALLESVKQEVGKLLISIVFVSNTLFIAS